MVAAPGRRRRCRHSADFKASVIRECLQPGVSMASVALANGLNALPGRSGLADRQQLRRAADQALGHRGGNWLFVGTLMAGQRAAAIMSLIQSAKLNGHDPYAYLKDVLARLPTQLARDIDDLLPNRWAPAL